MVRDLIQILQVSTHYHRDFQSTVYHFRCFPEHFVKNIKISLKLIPANVIPFCQCSRSARYQPISPYKYSFNTTVGKTSIPLQM